jgi:glycosyltransferase involved in cell wall biosynthesis
MIDYSIIIPAYNEELLLPATIRKLRAGMDSLSEMKGEILVVDNNSSDSTADVARKNGAR